MDRRAFTGLLSAAVVLGARAMAAQPREAAPIRRIRTGSLEIAYEESGPANGAPIVLLHGFPYDPRAFDDVVARLVQANCRAIVPYLRGFGPTRFLSPETMRSGQQAAMGRDVLDLIDVLDLKNPVLVGYDWGGRAACVVAALWPERVRALVSCNGYTIQDITASVTPAAPEQEHRMWYQYYFHTERGRAGLAANRREVCRLLWKLWSPNWNFDDATYARTAASFDNPDFVDVVIHSYRHRFGYVQGDPAFERLERLLAEQPKISVPSIVLQGDSDGVNLASASASASQRRFFSARYERRVIPKVGHNVPQEAPAATAEAVLDLIRA